MKKNIFEESFREYNDYMFKNISDYWEHYSFIARRQQIQSLIGALNDNFNFDKLITLETGASQNLRDGVFGLFLGMITAKTDGKMFAIDINRDAVDKSYELFKSVVPSLNYMVYESDSIKGIEMLKQQHEIPNIVHLDSYDLDLKNPFPSALHTWREFVLLEDKMPSGSIVIIDDNYRQGTWIDWHYPDGRIERINNEYPMIGKGANVYNYVLFNNSDWKLIGDHYDIFNNIKIIIQKK